MDADVKAIFKENGNRILCGAGVGLASSLFGGGGGMLAVPLLEKFDCTTKQAHATAILLILPIAGASVILYILRGLYDVSVCIPVALGVTLGGLLGAKLLGKLPMRLVRWIFILLQAAAGVYLAVS